MHPADGLKTCGGFCVGPALRWGSHHASAVRCCFTASGWCVCRIPPGCSQAGCRQGDTLPGGHSGALPHQVSCQEPSTSSHTANKATASLCLCVVVPLSRLPMPFFLGYPCITWDFMMIYPTVCQRTQSAASLEACCRLHQSHPV